MSEQQASVLTPKMIKWLRANGKEQFIPNKKLAAAIYAEHNKAKRIADLADGMKVEMKLFVVGRDTRKVELCIDCNRKVCQDSCGAQNYGVKDSYTIRVGDEYNGSTTLNLPPWHAGDIPEDNHAYLIRGVAKLVNADNNTFEIGKVEVVEEIGLEDFNPKGDVQASEEDEEEAEEAPKAKPKPTAQSVVKKAVKQAEEEEAEEAEEKPKLKTKKTLDDVAEDEEEKPKKAQPDMKFQKAVNVTRSYFRANEGVRKPKQLKIYLEQQGFSAFFDDVVAELALEKDDDGNYTYVDEE